MIRDKKDLEEYLEADYIAIHKPPKRSPVWRYLVVLRKTEYYKNTGRTIRGKLYSYLLQKYSLKTGISIHINNFGKGLGLFHYGSIVINHTARFGDWCVVQNGVNVAANVRGGGMFTLPLEQRLTKILQLRIM